MRSPDNVGMAQRQVEKQLRLESLKCFLREARNLEPLHGARRAVPVGEVDLGEVACPEHPDVVEKRENPG